MSDPLYVVSHGARTPLGTRAAPSAAALRAGISRIKELPQLRDRQGNPMYVSLDGLLPIETMGASRLTAIAQSALHEACELPSDRHARLQVPLLLALPEPRPGVTRSRLDVVAQELRGTAASVDITRVEVFAEGHAAGFMALARAAQLIEQGLPACLVGGVDSYYDPDTLDWLDADKRLAGGDARSAFIAGEGAAFVMVMSPAAAKSLQLLPLAQLLAVAIGQEHKPIDGPIPRVGEGLTQTIRAAIEALPADIQHIDAVICDINGERHRGEEWGFVCLRLGQYFRDPTRYRSPADTWGDMGAASCPLFVSLVIEAAARGYAKGERTLLWSGSDGGRRGAAVLEAKERSWRA